MGCLLISTLISLISLEIGGRLLHSGFLVDGLSNDRVNPIIKMVNPGDLIHIPCSVMHPGGSVQWIRNGKPILLDFSPTQRRHWNISNDGQASLTINRVTKTDEGVWECWELDSLGNVKQKAHVMKLVVTNIPEEPYIQVQGKRLEKSAKITVRENNGLTLECVVRGASPPVRTVYWSISGRNVTQSSQLLMEYSPQEDNYETRSLLVINVTKVEHNKVVICRAEHISWQHPVAVSASFNVLYEPSFTISREPGFGYPLVEGISISLKCEIDANPPSKPRWIKDGGANQINRNPEVLSPSSSSSSVHSNLVQSTATINLTSVKASDSGWYRCVTNHDFGYFESFGYYLHIRTKLPVLQQVLKLPLSPPSAPSSSSPSSPTDLSDTINKANQIEQRQGGLLSASSPPQSPPLPSLNGVGAKPSFQSASVSNSMDIMVNSGFYNNNNQQQVNVLQSLYGEEQYQQPRVECEENNGKPVVVAFNRTVMAIVGRPVALYVEFCCDPRPKRVYWIHRHLAMAPGRTIGPYITQNLIMSSGSRNCYTSQFDIELVKPEDGGEISFVASNMKGMGDAVILLNVTRASFSISSEGSSQYRNQWPTLVHLLVLLAFLVLK